LNNKEYQKKYRKDNKEDIKRKYQDNKEYHKQYRLDHKDKSKEYYKTNKERLRLKSRAGILRRNYNITIDQYNQMLKDQNECCAICHKHKSLFKKNLAVDHCHKTSKVRGLLCTLCNQSLGSLNEDVNVINNMIKYIEKHKEKVI
jgi:hypothetical protein